MAEPDETHYRRKRLIRELLLVSGVVVAFLSFFALPIGAVYLWTGPSIFHW